MAEEAIRGRNWATIVYPDSAPAGWMDRFADLHVPGFISPLHDRDVNQRTGEFKKPHYHVMMRIAGKVSQQKARAMFESIGGVGCEPVNDWAAMARYLCHLDESNNGKQHYNTGEVQMFGGADYFGEIERPKDRAGLIAEMQEWCERNGCVSLASLNRYARGKRSDWFRVLATSGGAAVMSAFLKSFEWEVKNGTASV